MEERDKEKDLEKLADAFFDNLEIGNCEYGGIGLNNKRPFGNSDVQGDILEIIRYDAPRCPHCDEYLTDRLDDYADELYQDLIPYLQTEWGKRKKQ